MEQEVGMRPDAGDLASDGRGPQPSYKTVHKALLGIIADQRSEGDALPSENQLASRFSVSRNTIRRALDLLMREGRIVRIPGKGTFVAGRAEPFVLRGVEGMNKAILDQGATERAFNRVEAMDPVPASESVAQRLGIPEDEPVVHIRRLRFLDEWPLSLDETFIVADVGERLRSVDLEQQDLFAVLEQRFSHPVEKAELKISAVAADPDIARALQVSELDPVLHVDRVGWSRGRRILCENLAFRSDRFVFAATALQNQGT